MNLPLDALALALVCVAAAALLRPWRMLDGPLMHPAAAALVLLPLLWISLHRQVLGVSLEMSGSCLLVLLVGWPLAVLILVAVAAAAALLAGWPLAQALDTLAWQGLLPATCALCIGWLVRRMLPPHPFVYLLARAFGGTVLVLTACGLARSWQLDNLASLGTDGVWVARLLLAFGEAIVTGMLATLLMVYRPQWLATFSDRLYLMPGPRRTP